MSYQHILVAVDGSPTSNHAVTEAAGLAKASGGRIRLLNVMDPVAHISGFERPEVYSQEVLPRLRSAGEALLRNARQVLAALEQMHANLSPFASGVRGHVSLWANTHATHTFLPDDLASFLRQHPQVSVTLEERTSSDIALAVAHGEIELGVLADSSAIDGSSVQLQPYRRDRLVLIVPPSHPLAGEAAVAFARVLGEPFVCLHAGSAIHTFMMNHAAQLGGRLDVRIQVRSFNAVCRMVAAGVGIGMVPRSAVGTADAVRLIEITDPWAPRDLQLCVRSRSALPAAAQALLVHLAGMGSGQAG